MKQHPLSMFHQVYSRALDGRPSSAWVIDLESEGVWAEMIDRSSEISTGWTGWGFLIEGSNMEYTTACLLFEHKEDAVMAKLVYGEMLYAN